MFIQVTRRLPDETETLCSINTEHIVWLQPTDDGGATLYLVAGPAIEVKDGYVDLHQLLALARL